MQRLYACGTLGPPVFSVADPSLWNSLPDSVRDPEQLQTSAEDTFISSVLKRLAY